MFFNLVRGEVVFYNPARCFGKIAGEDGTNYIVRLDDISTEDVYGLRYLLAGEQVQFTPTRDSDGRNVARAVTAERPSEAFDESYREDAVLTTWSSRYGNGFARRATGDSLHVDKKNVISEGELKEGVDFRFKPAAPKHGYAWRATEIQIYQDQEQPGIITNNKEIEKGDENG